MPPAVVPTMFGVVIVGLAPKTADPVPVSSEMTPANCAEVVGANCDNGLAVAAAPRLVRAVETLATSDRLFAAARPPRPESVTVVQTGTLLDPVEAMTCPDVEPSGLSNESGVSVVAEASEEKTSASARVNSFFILDFTAR